MNVSKQVKLLRLPVTLRIWPVASRVSLVYSYVLWTHSFLGCVMMWITTWHFSSKPSVASSAREGGPFSGPVAAWFPGKVVFPKIKHLRVGADWPDEAVASLVLDMEPVTIQKHLIYCAFFSSFSAFSSHFQASLRDRHAPGDRTGASLLYLRRGRRRDESHWGKNYIIPLPPLLLLITNVTLYLLRWTFKGSKFIQKTRFELYFLWNIFLVNTFGR